MEVGMLWYDNSTNDIEKKIDLAVKYYKEKYGNCNKIHVNPNMIEKKSVTYQGIIIVADSTIATNCMWIGIN